MDNDDVRGLQLSGYSTKEACDILYSDIADEIRRYQIRCRKSLSDWLTGTLHHNNRRSIIHWPSCLVLFLNAVFLLVAFGCAQSEKRSLWLPAIALVLLVTLVFNISITVIDVKLLNEEIVRQALSILTKLQDTAKCCNWSSENYLSLNTPASASITVQWTYRDGELVNLPTNLLVRGDIIVLRPGQPVPVNCKEIRENLHSPREVLQFNEGDNFDIGFSDRPESVSKPTAREPLQPTPFMSLDTPFLNNIRVSLENSTIRPVSAYDNEYFEVNSVWLERRITPLIMVLSLLVNILRWTLLKDDVSHWTEMLLTQQVLVTLPLLPLVVPVLWKAINVIGVAQIIAQFEQSKLIPDEDSHLDQFSTDTSLESDSDATVRVTWKQILEHSKKVVLGNPYFLPRTSNLAHTLGSMTSLCCTDKKGVLSWPNPSAEKVLFLTSTPQMENVSIQSLYGDGEDEDEMKNQATAGNKGDSQDHYVEVLDLTHELKNPFGIQFDDPSWRKHLLNLKPLGLNILLNTCNLATSHHYRQFFDHVNAVSRKIDGTVAVVTRRCLCELSRRIGFSEQATDIFKLDQQSALYRNPPPTDQRKVYLRKTSNMKNRIPMPHMMSVIANEIHSGVQQLFCQGTGDIVLDMSSDFWDGHKVCQLSNHDRKKILDFYHRYSMSSYCSAFAYRPLTNRLIHGSKDAYIELPESHDEDNMVRTGFSETDQQEKDCQYLGQRYHSAESLKSCISEISVDDEVNNYQQSQANMVFLGMITMQYQAKPDIVKLIDKLETACIRFVHFSDENELRSRVFSEKMGLEAGWNCHISLKSDERNLNTSKRSQMSSTTSCLSVSQRISKVASHVSGDVDYPRDSEVHHNVPSTDQKKVKAVGNFSKRYLGISGRSASAPSAINMSGSQVRFESTTDAILSAHAKNVDNNEDDFTMKDTDSCIERRQSSVSTSSKQKVSIDAVHVQIIDRLTPKMTSEQERLPDNEPDATEAQETSCLLQRTQQFEEEFQSLEEIHSESHQTSNTEESTSAAFDISNRAKLPKGIENIRPHLENVDNVPLLVNLFTDCTPGTITEMLKIMQENGEVVCCMGSSASLRNTPVFMQADISIAMEPLYPQLCMKEAVCRDMWTEGKPSPMELSSMLNSLGCSLSCQRDNNISLVKLIAQARSYIELMRNAFLLILSCNFSLILLQLLASIFQLPPVLSGQHLMWLLYLVVPALGITALGNNVDSHVMSVPSGKNINNVSKKVILEFMMYFMLRFVPSIIICLSCFGLNLQELCLLSTKDSNQCNNFLGNRNLTGSWNGIYADYHQGFNHIQNFLLVQIVAYFVCNCTCFVNRRQHLWKQSLLENRLWCSIVPGLLILQVVYSVLDSLAHSTDRKTFSLSDFPLASWVIAFVWPLFLLPLNELVKFFEIRSTVRYQKRVRLEFGTKLGMNSPF